MKNVIYPFLQSITKWCNLNKLIVIEIQKRFMDRCQLELFWFLEKPRNFPLDILEICHHEKRTHTGTFTTKLFKCIICRRSIFEEKKKKFQRHGANFFPFRTRSVIECINHAWWTPIHILCCPSKELQSKQNNGFFFLTRWWRFVHHVIKRTFFWTRTLVFIRCSALIRWNERTGCSHIALHHHELFNV